MTKEELRALIDEVEAFNGTAEEARALADRCLLACGWTRISEQVMEDAHGVPTYAQPNPILSRDDADALLPKRYGLANIEWQQHGARYRARVSRLPNLWPPFSVGFGHTEPCARTAAALRAELRRMENGQ